MMCQTYAFSGTLLVTLLFYLDVCKRFFYRFRKFKRLKILLCTFLCICAGRGRLWRRPRICAARVLSAESLCRIDCRFICANTLASVRTSATLVARRSTSARASGHIFRCTPASRRTRAPNAANPSGWTVCSTSTCGNTTATCGTSVRCAESGSGSQPCCAIICFCTPVNGRTSVPPAVASSGSARNSGNTNVSTSARWQPGARFAASRRRAWRDTCWFIPEKNHFAVSSAARRSGAKNIFVSTARASTT